MRRTVFYISDGTGITAETLGHSVLSQFVGVDFHQVTIPHVNSPEAAIAAVERVNAEAASDNGRPIIFSTLVSKELRTIMEGANGLYLELFSFLGQVKRELGMEPSRSVGMSHGIGNREEYSIRIDAVHFAMDNDDGARTRYYDQADIILVGVSRSGKTPTCLYLALQFGIRAANYPITEEDLEDNRLPEVLLDYRDKLFGLTIDAERLSAIRNERKANSRYSSLRQCEHEVRGVEAMLKKHGVPFVDSSELSIEEISTSVLTMTGIERRLQ